MIDALTDRMGRMIATPRGFYIFVGLYIGAVFLARAVPFPGSSDDTAELLLHSQYFAWGYGIGAGERALNRLGAMLMLLCVIVPLLLLAKFWFQPLRCRKCHLHIPYPAFAEDIRRAGFERGTIVSHFSRYKNGGILRPFFPDARIIDLKLLDLADPPRNIDAGQCLLIWDDVDDPGVREGVIELAGRRFDVGAAALGPMQTIARPMVNGPKRIIRLGFILIPEGAGKCR